MDISYMRDLFESFLFEISIDNKIIYCLQQYFFWTTLYVHISEEARTTRFVFTKTSINIHINIHTLS